ncbi:MAG TPA: type II toxin-antitoxin system VapC family toxin [Terracidiphilus sp.]
MRLLLDTHTLLWLAFDDKKLSSRALRLVRTASNSVLVSAASAWEIATKYRLGKLNFARAMVENFVPRVTAAGFELLPVSTEHALRAGLLAGEHRDPFDRMLAAQALLEGLPILSADQQLEAFGVRRIW